MKYPHDRINGFVLLTDGDNKPYVPRFTRMESDLATPEIKQKPPFWLYKRYWRAWVHLMPKEHTGGRK